MRIVIEHKNIIIATDVRMANTFWSRFKGWMGKKYVGDHEALIIQPCASVHTFGMKFAIDVLFLNSNNQVIHQMSDLKPNRISALIPHTCTIIELKEGTLCRLNVELLDVVSFENR